MSKNKIFYVKLINISVVVATVIIVVVVVVVVVVA
jgi:hypothetical protein